MARRRRQDCRNDWEGWGTIRKRVEYGKRLFTLNVHLTYLGVRPLSSPVILHLQMSHYEDLTPDDLPQ